MIFRPAKRSSKKVNKIAFLQRGQSMVFVKKIDLLLISFF